MGLKDDFRHVPPWGWAALAGGAGLLVLVRLRGHAAAAAPVALAGPAAPSDPGALPVAASGDAPVVPVPPATATATAAPTQSGLNFRDWYNLAWGYHDPANNGFNGNATDTLAGGRDWGQTLAQFHSDNPAFQAWQQQGLQGFGPGNTAAAHQWYDQGQQFLADAQVQAQVVQAQGQIGQYTKVYPVAAGTGGGGVVATRDADELDAEQRRAAFGAALVGHAARRHIHVPDEQFYSDLGAL